MARGSRFVVMAAAALLSMASLPSEGAELREGLVVSRVKGGGFRCASAVRGRRGVRVRASAVRELAVVARRLAVAGCLCRQRLAGRCAQGAIFSDPDGRLVLQPYLLMWQGLQALFHLETVILSPSTLLGMYLSKDDGLPEAALFDTLCREPAERLRVLVLPNCGCTTIEPRFDKGTDHSSRRA